MSEPWNEVIAFWKQAGSQKWFAKDDHFDAEIINRFSGMYEDTAAGVLDAWADDPKGCLALILVLDQFSRNMFRGDAKSFAADEKALEFARLAVSRKYGPHIDEDLRPFLFMPFMHSESMPNQEESVRLQEQGGAAENIDAAKWHLDIIRRFGRFPHRNAVLGRKTTEAEQLYLDDGGFKG